MDEQRKNLRMMTIRETTKTGIMREHTLRRLVKQGTIPHIKSGNRVLINYERLVEMLETL